jgi:hypothetical protein
LIVDALEKMRDYISSENKKMREDFFKLHLDIEAKMREKLDKKDIEDIESNILLIISFRKTDRKPGNADK